MLHDLIHYYGTQSDIRLKSYCRLIFLSASVFNYERLDILRDSIGHPSKKLLSFEFPQCKDISRSLHSVERGTKER